MNNEALKKCQTDRPPPGNRPAVAVGGCTEPEPFGAAGFTLLEVLVALGILALVLTAVYRLNAASVSLNYSARFDTTAPLLAQQKLAEAEALPLTAVGDDQGNFGDEFPGYRWELSVEPAETATRDVREVALMRIDVTVSAAGTADTFHLRTYRVWWR